MRKPSVTKRLASDLASFWGPTLERLTDDLAADVGSQKLTPAERRAKWDSLPDLAPPGEPSKMTEWLEAQEEPRYVAEILRWEQEKPAAPATDAFGQRR